MANEFNIEGVSPEEIQAAIKDNPVLQKVYNSLMGGYTKARQKDSEQLTNLQTQVDELSGAVQQWETWGNQAQTYIENLEAGGQPEGDRGSGQDGNRNRQPGNRGKGADPNAELAEKLAGIENIINQANTTIMGRFSIYDRMLDLNLQLNDLYRRATKEGRELDAQKVLKLALDRGYPTLNDAYEATYRDDIVNKTVDEKVQEKLKEELAKHKTEVETGSGNMGTHLSFAKEAPKTFSEASKQTMELVGKGELNKE